MRQITIVSFLALGFACARPSGDLAAPTKSQPAALVESAGPAHYCDVFPDRCRPCPGEPGSCGGVPVAGACCCEGGGCVAVEFASDCDVGCDFYSCEWGYQWEDADGTPQFTCYD